MKKLIVIITGKKQSGKNTLANQIAAMYLNTQFKAHEASVNDRGEFVVDDKPFGRADKVPPYVIDIGPGGFEQERFYGRNHVRILSFADPLKQFCINVLGLPKEACYGTDGQKNKLTHVRWDGLPLRVRLKYRAAWWHWPRTGYMTGREVMQVFGTDLIRAWYDRAWAKAAITEALNCQQPLVIMPDGRFPNEVNEGLSVFDSLTGVYVRTVRMKRKVAEDKHPSETALDHYTDCCFDGVFPDRLTIDGQGQLASEIVLPWLVEARLVEESALKVKAE